MLPNSNTSERWLMTISLVFASFVLCFMGFYNGYPIVYSDTGTYILSGFDGFVPGDRTILYGLFVRHISLSESLWFVIITQGFLLALVLFYYFYYLITCSVRLKIILFLSYIILITFYFGASINVSTLIPDIFTPIAILCIGLLLFIDKLKIRDIIIVSIILVFSIGVHNSHIYIAFIIIFFAFLGYGYEKIRRKTIFFYSKIRRLILLTVLAVSSILITGSLHLAFGGGFKYTQGGHVYLLNRLYMLEILKEYLDEHCSEKNYNLCQYKDSIPWDFLWDSRSPLYKTGGWSKNREEYNKINKDILFTPKYLKIFIIRTLESSFNQFCFFDNEKARVEAVNSAPWIAIVKCFPKTQKLYLSSLQNRDYLDYSYLNQTQKVAFSLLLLLFFVLIISKTDSKWKLLLLFFLTSLYANAIICTLSCVVSRFQSRVIWLLPLPIFIIFSDRKTIRMIQEFVFTLKSKILK